jgi:hypothetical protein
MATDVAASGPTRRWTRPRILRLVDRESVTPIRLGLTIAALLSAVYLAAEWAAGRFAVVFAPDADPEEFQDFRISFVLIAAIAYVPAAQLAVVRSVRRTIGSLGAGLRLTDEGIARVEQSVGTCETHRYWRSRTLWLGFSIVALIVADLYEDGLRLGMQMEPFIHRLLIPVLVWLSVGLYYCVSADSRRLAELARSSLDFQLPDTSPLAPFAQAGTQLALVNVGLLSIMLLFLGDLDASPAVVPVLALAGATILIGAGLVMMRPLRAARDAIRAHKAMAIADCDERIRALRSRWDRGASRDDGAPRAPEREPEPTMADVIAYRGMIDAIHEWPVSTPLAARLALYAGLPLGSWIAGAMVERGLDALLR